MSPDPSSFTPSDGDDPRKQAERCRRLARSVTDQQTLDALNEMTNEYEARARGSECA